MSIVLAIETSNPASALAPASGQGVAIGVLERGVPQVLASEEVAAPSRTGDELIPAIDRAVRRAGVGRREIGVIAVSVGPGGFTGLRVAVATAKMLALTSTVEGGGRCIAVPSALVAAWPHTSHAPVAVALSGKHETAHVTVFEAGFDRPGGPIARGIIMGPADIAGLAAQGVTLLLADSHLPESMRLAAERAGIRVERPVFAAVNALHAAAVLPMIGAAELLPLYPREPEAVTLWRARKKA